MDCLNCGIEIAPNRSKYCSRKCQTRDHQRRRSPQDTINYYSKSPRNFFQSLLQKKTKNRQELDLDFLEALWEKQKGRCAISNVPMTHVRGQGKVQTNVSIDRIDSQLGYTKENTQLVCHIVNLMKSDMTLEQLLFWTDKILSNVERK